MFKRLMSLDVQILLFDKIYYYQRKFESKNILPEHLLLAILDSDRIKYSEYINLNERLLKKITQKIKQYIKSYDYSENGTSFSTRLNRVIENSIDISKSKDKELLDVEDLLYALSEEQSSIFNEFLNENSINFKKEIKNNNKKDSSENRNLQFMNKYSKNLTDMARDGQLDPIIGRESEITRMIQILSRRKKNNPILVGEPGIGKTALVESLALKIANKDVPSNLLNTKIISLDLNSMIAGTKYRGEFEDRLKKLVSIILQEKDIILFIDEIHTLVGAGNPEGQMDAANILKPALSRGEFQCIGATTLSEYRKKFEKDPALERRFQMILLEPPTDEETIEVLKGIKENFEKFHLVKYDDDAIVEAVKLSSRFITDRFQPDKAIDILDEAGAAMKVINNEKPKNILKLENQVSELEKEKLKSVENFEYIKAASIKNTIDELNGKLEVLNDKWADSIKNDIKVIDKNLIRKVISSLTSIPVDKIEQAENKKLVNFEKDLNSKVIGQTDAVAAISSAIRKSRIGLNPPNRPLGSFLFLGPTGVGKTHLAKTLAISLFGSEDALMRIDMSDYMEKFNVSKLVGPPPGYIGFENGGILTEKIRRKPYSVILFDEIEKAHPDVFNILLQAFEEGEIIDSLGHKVSFRNCVIIMTSNLGAKDLSRENLGFDKVEGYKEYNEIKESALNEMKKFLSPEFINRIDDIIVFKSLEKKSIDAIFKIMFDDTKDRFKNIGIEISITPEAKKFIIDKEFSYKYGARVIRRAISKYIEDAISVKILSNKNISKVKISLLKDELDYCIE